MADTEKKNATKRDAAREMGFHAFDSWDDLRALATQGDDVASLYYWAPLDRRPVRVHVRAVHKNGRVRVSPGMRGACAFTADAGHLDRFFTSVTPAVRFARAAADAVDRALVELACVEGTAERAARPDVKDAARALASRLRDAGAWALVQKLEADRGWR